MPNFAWKNQQPEGGKTEVVNDNIGHKRWEADAGGPCGWRNGAEERCWIQIDDFWVKIDVILELYGKGFKCFVRKKVGKPQSNWSRDPSQSQLNQVFNPCYQGNEWVYWDSAFWAGKD